MQLIETNRKNILNLILAITVASIAVSLSVNHLNKKRAIESTIDRYSNSLENRTDIAAVHKDFNSNQIAERSNNNDK